MYQAHFLFLFQTPRLLCAAAIVVNARLASHSFAATQALNGKATDRPERCLRQSNLDCFDLLFLYGMII
jgi:hypothetical protein